MYKKLPAKRYQITLDFLNKHCPQGSNILDLGVENPFSNIMKENGYNVKNTQGEDLDSDFNNYLDTEADVITSLEIFEHMFAPFNILRALKTDKLIASVPLKLWFTDAYWNKNDDRDKHYHEFEKKQFDLLLKKTGWEIKDSHSWASGDWKKIGIRPILRHFTDRYYIVYCERKKDHKL